MPGRDKTGPRGDGPFGRGMGGCFSTDNPNSAAGFGQGRRNGRGRGGWFRFGGTSDLQTRKSFLERELNQLNKILDASADHPVNDTKAE